MRHYIYTLILFTVATTAAAHGKWEVGVMGGAGFAKFRETLNIDVAGTPARYKFTYKGGGPIGGIRAGYSLQNNKNLYAISLSGYKDFYSLRNKGIKQDTLGNTDLDTHNDVKRKYTVELAGTLGRTISSQIAVYGKLGILNSAFQAEYINDLQEEARKTIKGWGGVIGCGIKKIYENGISAGVEYNYQYYERVGINMIYGPALDSQNRSKVRPQYHNVFLTISKAF